MFVDQSHVTVVGVTGAIAVVTEVEEFGDLGHRSEGMIVVEWIGAGPPRSGALEVGLRGGAGWIDFGFFMARPSCYSPGKHDQAGNVTALKKIESPRRGAA